MKNMLNKCKNYFQTVSIIQKMNFVLSYLSQVEGCVFNENKVGKPSMAV